MSEQIYRLVLLDREEKNYHLINDYLGQLKETTSSYYKLDWQPRPTERNLSSQQYDLYLLNSQLLPCINEQILSQLSKKLNCAPIIILTDNYQTGIIATEAGAADYLDTTELTIATLERSLRLTLAYKKLHHQSTSTAEQLRASEALYAGIFNHSADGIFLMDILANGQLVYETVNPAYQEIAGMTKEEVAGKTIAEVAPPEIATLLERQYRACIAGKKPFSYEHTLEVRGDIRTWRTILVPIANSQGKIVKLQGSSRDITSEKRAIAQQIRQTRYRYLLRSVTLKIRQSLELDRILQATVTELQKTLNADRVLLFQFLPDGSGKVIKEAVLPDFPAMLDTILIDRYCRDKLPHKYFEGYVYACEDSDRASLSACHREMFQKYQIRANLVLPIFPRRLTKRGLKNCFPQEEN
jgi:PAS domain S-box-containing protein